MAEVFSSDAHSVSPSIKLDDLGHTHSDNMISIHVSAQPSDSIETNRRDEAVALHPVDGGIHAWLFVLCSFILECMIWGFPFGYLSSSRLCPSMHQYDQVTDWRGSMVLQAMVFFRIGTSLTSSKARPKVRLFYYSQSEPWRQVD